MATIGYGDYYPRTLPGRLVIIATAVFGVFLVSILVVALTNTLNSILLYYIYITHFILFLLIVDISESKAHNVIKRL